MKNLPTCFANKNIKDMKRTTTMLRYVSVVLIALFGLAPAVLAQTDHTGPTVGGAVYGGGRMADVSGNAVVTVHNADSLGAVYGGNDISGAVTGTATVTVGTANTSTSAVNAEGTPLSDGIKIGSVYGGGNGHYANYIDGGEALPADAQGETLTVPTVTRTTVTIVNDASARDLVQIDSLFGGAKAANLTGTGTTVDLNINGGAIIAAFGGNNYGGTISGNVDIDVTATSLANNATSTLYRNVENSATSGFGRDFGIRYLFGGGNKVELATSVTIDVIGGMIDTAFAGGNSATVGGTTFTVNATDDNSIFVNTSTDNNDASYDAYMALSHNSDGKYGPAQWVGGKGTYNIHTLFGGNNQAEMGIVPTLTLTSGGIGTVYGGGNAGDMTGSTSVSMAAGGTTENFDAGTKVVINSSNLKADYVYGGCQMANVAHSTYVDLKDCSVGTVFGGCNISGNVGSSYTNAGTNVYVEGGTVYANIFGGANGYYHCNDFTYYIEGTQFKDNDGEPFDPTNEYIGLPIPTHNHAYVFIPAGTSVGDVYGNVYAAGNLANVGYNSNYAGNTYGHGTNAGSVDLNIDGGNIKGTVYGGGNMASVYGSTLLNVSGGTIGKLYAANDKTGSVESFAAYSDQFASDGKTPLNTVHINEEGDTIGTDAIYSTYLHITGHPVIDTIFGGGNGDYDYENIDHCLACDGVQKPIQKSTLVDINMDAEGTGHIGVVVGGGNGVTVDQNVTILLNNADTMNSRVNTIFGGNNRAWMRNIIPNILLVKGTADTVYGGGNAGHMLGIDGTKTDLCGDSIAPVSTYVQVNSDDVNINTIYGGCKMADLIGIAYVEVQKGHVQTVYGGNNISGKVTQTRVDIVGGTVDTLFGGSNGKYEYSGTINTTENTCYDGKAYRWGHAGDEAHLVAEGNAKLEVSVMPPYVGEARVNIYGGNVNNSVFGGGNLGNCGETYVLVDDSKCTGSRATGYPDEGAVIKGQIYGGGAGNFDNLCAEHKGNVVAGTYPPTVKHGDYTSDNFNFSTGLSKVDLVHAKSVGDGGKVIAYGGGKGGDVQSTEITVYDTWNLKIDELYGGCWGSDVFDSAHVTVNGNATEVVDLYGGNNYSGNVRSTTVDINAGEYTNIYGAGNGTETPSGTPLPNIEDVVINIADNTTSTIKVNGNLYGGGRLGTTFKTVTDHINTVSDDNETITTYIPQRGTDCTLVRNTAFCNNSELYPSHILINIHGGEFMHDIYAGGAGAEGGNQITYAVKQINMENGIVHQSIYGGTQNVNDGFPDCVASATTVDNSMPSSIVNITGGDFKANVYGGGYLGNIYGSTYVNVGIDAVNNSPVWTNSYRSHSFASYKPTFTDTEADNYMAAHDLALETSVFAGANWGEAGENANFDEVRGYYGGESRILIDGTGYNASGMPNLDIVKSIIGAGTSTKGGDIVSNITFRNYGKVNGCNGANKQIESIQRADSLVLNNTAIVYKGSVDASSAYSAVNFAINRIANFIAKGYNNITVERPVDNIGALTFVDNDGNVISTPLTSGDGCSTCEQYSLPNAETNPATLFYVMNGSYIRVGVSNNGNITYGPVNGYGYAMTDEGFKAQMMASTSTPGGYVSPCSTLNEYTDGLQINYKNLPAYRVWSVGEGTSAVTQQIDAFSDPAAHSDVNRMITTSTCDGQTHEMSLAKATLYLPVTESGHYYQLDSTVIRADEAKGLRLNSAAWRPTGNFTSLNDDTWSESSEEGTTITKENINTETGCIDASKLVDHPDDNFALMLVPGEGFGTGGTAQVAIAPASNFNASPYMSPAVSADGQPQVDLYLTYNNQFAKTIVGDVTFSFTEYSSTGQALGTIDVTITINTIIDKFKGTHVDLLAMNNEGTSNTYVRKRIIPATLSTRKLYLSSVRWEEANTANKAGAGHVPGDRHPAQDNNGQVLNNVFYLTDGAVGTNTSLFNLKATLSDDIAGNLTSINGWYQNGGYIYDIYSLTKNNTQSKTFGTSEANTKHSSYDTINFTKYPSHYKSGQNVDGEDTVTLGADGFGVYDSTTVNGIAFVSDHAFDDLGDGLNKCDRGIYLGTLDGRASAAIDYELGFNGSLVYPNGFVGRVILDYIYYKGDAMQGRFYDTIYVRARDHGDTIYVASANSVSRTCDGHTYTVTPALVPASNHFTDEDFNTEEEYRKALGKSPELYIHTFDEAFDDPYVYQEGDVFAIIDQVDISSNMVLRGPDMTRVPVIRYSGHHGQLPGDCAAYKGTMINVKNRSRFSAFNVTFDGSSLSPVMNTATGEKEANTLKAEAPIILVENGSTLALEAGTVVRNNHNISTDNPGAIRLIGNTANNYPSTLTLNNGITIENNFNTLPANFDPKNPTSGAIQAELAQVQLGTSATGAIVIDKNYLISDDAVYWTDDETSYNKRAINPSALTGLNQANVFLGRAGKTTTLCGQTTDSLEDKYNSLITFSSDLPTGSHIGISKEFPGVTVRDTISVVLAKTTFTNHINNALNTYLFTDNDAYDFYYNNNSADFNGQRFYYHRCASFRNQLDNLLCEDAVINYNADLSANCPVEGESLTYGFRGGFAPYSVEWKKADATVQTATIDTKPAELVMSDSYTIPFADMDMGAGNSAQVTYTISAVDNMGCKTAKTVDITFTKSAAESGVTYGEGNAANTDTNRANTATIVRNYKGYQLIANIWPEATAGSVAASDENGTTLDLANTYFCDGEVITLTATPSSGKSFAMWDFDPYDQPTTPYIINPLVPEVTAYFTPGTRWINYVNSGSVAGAEYSQDYYYAGPASEDAGFVTTHDGDVHIYNENGLAWFISMVNGINGAQAHPYYFNRVYLHEKEGGYDMKDYLWTPVGREQHPFRGRFYGVSSDAADTALLTDSRVIIKNIIVNEPGMSNVGFFGVLDTAVVKGIEIQSSLFHGAQYVGGIAAKAVNGVTLNNVKVGDTTNANLTMITTHYVSGGILGSGDGSAKPIKLGNAEASAKYMGDAVYSGGIVGEATNMTIQNTFARNDDRMEAVYKGGVAGRMNGTGVNAKSADGNSVVRNNYVYMISNGGAQNMGGLVAYARNTVMENNYVYGKVEGSQLHGAVGADLGNGVYADNNYYEQHSATQQVGNGHGTAHVNTVVTFAGQGNDVTTSQPVYGVDNLTRVLNIWVRDHRQEGDYRTWRSDLTGSNGGYPIFGTPDMITVRDSATYTACDSIEIDGVVYTESAVINTSVIDSLMMIDSTTTLTLVIHHGSHETYTDSATFGESYFGYGFSLTATETELLRSTVDEYGTATLVLSDTLQTENGCDSIVTLNLVLTDNLGIVETGTTHIAVYPNPTTARVTVEAEQLRFVEVYDNEGRRLMATPEADNHMSTTVDVSNFASGVYYLRVHTQNSVTIQKLIKK